ncbi:hypothetical protein F4859DRAFT_523125 [Xylaria cf. heliscus]|nr:hypothetical protein F4859DRAFT_523125 [Xylaria cf. heliscus]
MNHVVVVDGLLPRTGNTPQRWVDSQGQTWPSVYFPRDFPLVHVTIFRRQLGSAMPLWDEVQNNAGALVEKLDTLDGIANSQVLFLCHGLGAFIALQALSISRSDRWKLKCSKANTAFALFGTPLVYDNQNMFRKLLRACATVELDLPTKADNPTSDDVERLATLVKDAERSEFQFICVHEQQKSSYFKKMSFLGGPATSKFIIGLQAMKMKRAMYLPVDRDHLNCASWDLEVYNCISALLRNHSRLRLDPMQELVPTPVESDTQQAAVRVKSRPDRRMRSNTAIHRTSSHEPLMFPPHRLDVPKNEYFVGRHDVLDLIADRLVIKNLETEQSRRRAFALYAPPGYGKTQVARQFAETHMAHFKSILWLFADSEYKILDGFAAHALYLGLVEKSASPNWVKEAKDALWEWYRKTDQPWLVIFDNAVDQKLINSWWPYGPAGSILITTNDPAFGSNNVAGDGAELDELDSESGVKMVLNQITRFAQGHDKDLAKAEALKLVESFGHLPLAIQTAVGIINDSSRTLAQWNRRASTELVFKPTAQFNFNYAPYPKGLAQAFANRIESLDETSRALLDVLSLLDPDLIPEQLIDQGNPAEDIRDIEFVSNFDHCISRLSKGFVLRGGRRTKHEALDQIKDTSSFHMHRLLREFVRMHMNSQRRQAAFETASRLLSLAVDIRNYPHDAVGILAKSKTSLDREYFSTYLGHIESLRLYYEDCRRHEKNTLKVPVYFLTALQRSSWLCYRTSYFKVGLDHVKTGLDVLQQVKHQAVFFVDGTESTACSSLRGLHYNRACIDTEIGDFQSALESFLEYKRQYDASGEFDVVEVSKTFGGIANSYQGLGNHDKAIEYYEKCLNLQEWSRQIHSPYQVNICRSYWAQGKNDLACKRLEELLERRQKELGPESDATGYHDYIYGHMNYVLGNVYIAQQREAEGFNCHKLALACWRKTMGEDHHKTGDAWHKLGCHFYRQRHFGDAKIYLDRALEVYRAGFNETFRCSEIARTTYKLGLVEELIGNGGKAQHLIKQAEEIRKSLHREEKDEKVTEATYDKLVSLWSR